MQGIFTEIQTNIIDAQISYYSCQLLQVCTEHKGINTENTIMDAMIKNQV
jgi:hypothetical protein